jgi:predicted dehydrogenase
MNPVRIGIVGAGRIAQVTHLPILLKSKAAEVVAVCDRDRQKPKLVAEKFGIRQSFVDMGTMLSQTDLDAVVICASTDAHKDLAVAALEAGKDIFIEKPIARTFAEAAAIAEAAKQNKRKVMVGMNQRFRPDTLALKAFLDAKEIGKLMYSRAGWLRKRSSDSSWFTNKEKSGGGVFVDLGIVMLDLSLWLHGYPEVTRVSASLFKQKTKTVEDTSLVTLTLGNGCTIILEVSWSMHIDDDIHYCYTFGSEGTASLTPLRLLKELHGNMVNVAPARMESPQASYRKSYENELAYFLNMIQGEAPPMSTAEESVQRMKIVDAVYKSAKLGREVVL